MGEYIKSVGSRSLGDTNAVFGWYQEVQGKIGNNLLANFIPVEHKPKVIKETFGGDKMEWIWTCSARDLE